MINSLEWKYIQESICYFSIVGMRGGGISSSRSNHSSTEQRVKIIIKRYDECYKLNDQDVLQLNYFRECFAEIDGESLSQKDRNTNRNKSKSNSSSDNNRNRRKNQHDKLSFSQSILTTSSTSQVVSSSLMEESIPIPTHTFTSSTKALVDEISLTFAEVEFIPFVQLLHDCGAQHGHNFFDLGSGAGKAVAAAALSDIRFFKIVGIEVLPSLVTVSKSMLKKTFKCKSSHGLHYHSNSSSGEVAVADINNHSFHIPENVREGIMNHAAPLHNCEIRYRNFFSFHSFIFMHYQLSK